MIKKLMFLAVSFVCLTACNNDNGFTNDEAQNVKVKFNVQALNVSVQPMAISKGTETRAMASDVITNIHYSLKNTATGKWYSGVQTLASAGNDFGNIDLWIPSGTYQATFFGYGLSNPNGSALMYVDEDYNKNYITLKDKDSFFVNTQCVVSDENNTIDINLTRLNGKLVVKLNDLIPSEIKKVKIELSYYPLYDVSNGYATYENSDGKATKVESYLNIQDSHAQEYELYILPQNGRTLTLSVYDESGAELGSYSIAVSFYQNKRTILEGNILDVINQKPFSITVSDEWGTDVNVPIQ